MFGIRAQNGDFSCEYPADLSRVILMGDVETDSGLTFSQLLTKAENSLGGERVYVSMMPGSLDLRTFSEGRRNLIGCDKSDAAKGLRWEGKRLSEQEKIAASAFLSILAHLVLTSVAFSQMRRGG